MLFDAIIEFIMAIPNVVISWLPLATLHPTPVVIQETMTSITEAIAPFEYLFPVSLMWTLFVLGIAYWAVYLFILTPIIYVASYIRGN